MSDISRITGIVSGLDTDSLVEDLMEAEEINLNKLEQEKTYLEWEQEAYREVINDITAFQDTYFNYTSATNLLSASTFNSNAVEFIDESLSSYLSVSANADAAQGNYTISNITVATTASTESSASLSAEVRADSINAGIVIDSSNNQFNITFNDVTLTINLATGTYTDLTDLQAEVQSQVDDAVGSGNITVNLDGDASSGQLVFTTDTTNEMTLSPDSDSDALDTLGFSDVNLSNRVDLNSNLADISDNFATALSVDGSEDDISFTINGETFTFTSTTTSLEEIIETVNDSDAGVEITYDELNDQFTIETDDTGSAQKIEFSDLTGNLLESLQFDTSQTYYGSDATLEYDDGSGSQTITRASNKFSFNGITINLKEDYTGEIDFSIESSSDQVMETITAFVEDYNALIEDINSRLDEERDYDYEPLTDEEEEEMSEDEIEKWNEKAKTGILADDSTLTNMVSKMRTALYDSVEGAGISLYEIGITTSDEYEDQGKLVIDEDALAEAIESDPEAVTELFTASGDDYDSNGLSQRLDDIMDSNVSTSMNENGYNGTLLELAGIENDDTEYDNSLTEQIEELKEEIEEQKDHMSDLEDKYYNQFAAMEIAISQMDTIASYISSFTSS
ncbi:flagellar filament capping protein FliD [Iocasia frigidifontis]|uniref:Flagellar hook-associated protein 2 n=1 Tax=Iocasia fonsfrigidae TaxID=2682810 RepID=A0A8A7KBD1_9FIRM|nr:flagellar filament capping protein FliD [Iocasia fonsfrigidae]QTL98751.1 flagellar filament capping protein FliD [Iocasia fonsfrigidae]